MLRKEGAQSDLVYILKESWWVLLFIFLTFSGFLFATSSQKKLANEIQQKIKSIKAQTIQAADNKELLEQKLYSKEDPDYIKMTLIKVLGVTPKGQKKVIFDRLD